MDGDPIIGFEAEGAELETSTRHVAVIWSGDEDDSPEVVFGGCSTFEAYGLLAAAIAAMKRELVRSIALPDEMLVDEDVDDA